MRAGSLTERVVLLEPVKSTPDASGALSLAWREHAVSYAEYRPGASFQQLSADELFGGHKAVFIMRAKLVPHTGWRLQHIGGELYKIVAEPVVQRSLGMQTITCERINQ